MFWLSFVVLIINSQIREPIVNVFIFFFKSPGWFQSASSTWLLVVCCCWHSLLPWWSLSSPCETPSTWSGCTHVTWCHKYVTSATPSPVPSTSWSRVWDSKSAPWPNSRTAKRFSHIQIRFSPILDNIFLFELEVQSISWFCKNFIYIKSQINICCLNIC